MNKVDRTGIGSADAAPSRALPDRLADLVWRSLASVPFLMVASGVAFILVVNALIGYGIWQNRRDALAAARHGLEQAVGMLDEHVTHTVETADWLFTDIDYMLSLTPGGDTRAATTVFRYLRLRREAFAQMVEIVVLGPDGRVRHQTAETRASDLDLGDRRYFTVHRDRPDAGLFVGSPLASRAYPGTMVIPISRRVTLPDGSFGGVVVILLGPSALDAAFSSMRVGQRGTALLALADGTVLTNQHAADPLVGGVLADWPALADAMAQGREGTRLLESRGGTDQLVSFHRTKKYPFVVVTTQPLSDALADWRRDTAAWSFIGLAMTSAIAVLTWFVVRQHRRREQDQEKLAQASRRIRGILESMMDAVITIDSHGRIETFNRAAETMFGYRENEAVGQPIDLLIPEPFRQDHGRWLAEYRPGRGSRIIGNDREVMAQRRDGGIFPMNLAVSELVLNNGDAAAPGTEPRRLFVGVIRDITVRKQKEAEVLAAKSQAEMANRAKSEFLANMSHELRTPLNAIIGFSEILDSEFFGKLNERQKSCAKDIHDSGRHLLDIVNAVLDMSKIEAGHYELTEELLDPVESLTQCLTMVRDRAGDAGIELVHDLGTSLPPIWADRRAFKQVILNLLSNAVKFTPSGGRVTLDAALDEDGCLLVSVTDTGIGIPAEFLPHLFQPFRQADNSTSRRYEGTGLGLSISKNFMELHGGTLTCASEEGVGTTMTIRLPAARVMSGESRNIAFPSLGAA